LIVKQLVQGVDELDQLVGIIEEEVPLLLTPPPSCQLTILLQRVDSCDIEVLTISLIFGLIVVTIVQL